MKFPLVFSKLLFLLPIVTCTELRNEETPQTILESTNTLEEEFALSRSGLKTQTVVGNFPGKPQYLSFLTFEEDGVCSKRTGGSVVITNTCLSNGATSEKFTCSKLIGLKAFYFKFANRWEYRQLDEIFRSNMYHSRQ
jgi:hypothetical protein